MTPEDLAAVTRWQMRALELVRRIHATGLDPDEELSRLQALYAKGDTIPSLRRPEPGSRPTLAMSPAQSQSLREAAQRLGEACPGSRPRVLGVEVPPRG